MSRDRHGSVVAWGDGSPSVLVPSCGPKRRPEGTGLENGSAKRPGGRGATSVKLQLSETVPGGL